MFSVARTLGSTSETPERLLTKQVPPQDMRPGVTDSSSASQSMDELLDKLDKFRVLRHITQSQFKPIKKRGIP